MKPYLIGILYCFLLIGCNSKSSKPSQGELIKIQTEGPSGFNGIDWGTSEVNVATKMGIPPDRRLDGFQLYKNVTVDGISADLSYDFNESGLYAITHEKTYSEGDAAIDKDFPLILKHYTDLFGKPGEVKGNNYRWFWPHKQARLYKLPKENNYGTITPPMIMMQIETGKKY